MNRFKLFLAFAIFPIGTRLLILAATPANKSGPFLLGFTADIYWALAISLIALLMSFGRALLALPLFFLWAGAYAVDLENVSALGQLAHHSNVKYLFDSQFLDNTLGSLSAVKFFSALAIFTVALVLLFSAFRHRKEQKAAGAKGGHYIVIGEIVVLILSGLALFMYTPTMDKNTSNWHNRNFFAVHLDAMAAGALMPLTAKNPITEKDRQDSIFSKDLSATRPIMGDAKNVLVITVEGISGGYIESVAKYMGTSVKSLLSRNNPIMPELSQLAEEGFVIPNYISHRTQTIRGLYSMLCSDYPKLLTRTPKALELLSLDGFADRCLPRILKKKGYSTHYFQAAQLQFMSKHMIMPFIGFDDVRGRESFDLPSDYYFHWGPDDKDFATQAAQWVIELGKQEQPWFATLLTVGTHHPYALAGTNYVGSRKLASVELADKAIGQLVREIKASGIMEDTLVIITSDESHGIPGHNFGNNWGFMIALAPDLKPQMSDDVFSTVDFTVSMLDYLNLLDDKAELNDGAVIANNLELNNGSNLNDHPDLMGRSFFRDYDTDRTLVFAQWDAVAMSSEKGVIIRCLKREASFLQWLSDSNICYRRETKSHEMFGTDYSETISLDMQSNDDIFRLQRAIGARLQNGKGGVQNYSLSKNNVVELGKGKTIDLVSGQYLSFDKNSVVTIDMDVSYTSSNPAVLTMFIETSDLFTKKHGRTMLEDVTLPTLNNGERLQMSISFPAFFDYKHVQINLYGRIAKSSGSVMIHNYTIKTEKVDKFESHTLQLVKGTIIKADVSQTIASVTDPGDDQKVLSTQELPGDGAGGNSIKKVERLLQAQLQNPKMGPIVTIPLVLHNDNAKNRPRFVRAKQYTLGTEKSLNDLKTFLTHTSNDWWFIERWGVWSKENPELNFFLGKNKLNDDDTLLLSIKAGAFLTADMDPHSVDVYANGKVVESWKIEKGHKKYTAEIPAGLVNNGFLGVDLVITSSLITPKMKKENSLDLRKLGIGLVNFKLSLKK